MTEPRWPHTEGATIRLAWYVWMNEDLREEIRQAAEPYLRGDVKCPEYVKEYWRSMVADPPRVETIPPLHPAHILVDYSRWLA